MDVKPSKKPTKTSVIIPFFNNKATVGHAVRSVLQCEPPADEIVVVDDGSTDGGKSTLDGLLIRLIEKDHKGRSGALNAGIEAATGDLILFTDADCIVPFDWVKKLTDAFVSGEFDGVGGNLIPSRFTVIETAKVLRYVHEFEADKVLQGSYQGVCLNGNNMAIKKSALLSIGGFDENYIHGADAALTRALLDAGHKLLRTRSIYTTHLKVDDLRGFLRTFYMRGSTVRFAMDAGRITAPELIRAILISPFKNFAKDLLNVLRLSVFDPSRSWIAKGIGAAFVNLLGAFTNAFGQVHFFMRFKKGGV